MFKSKRFLITSIVLICYLIGVWFFKIEPLNYALGLTALLSPYLFGQSYRGSNKQ